MPDSPPRILVFERSPDLLAETRVAADWLDGTPVVQACPSPAALEAALADAPADVIVVGPSFVDRAGLRRLAGLHRLTPSASILLAVAERPDAALREIIRAGADDLLALPVEESELALALERAVRIARRRWVVPMAVEPVQEEPSHGQVVTVVSPTGGCGKSFLATNTALFLARETGRRVVLVDLDLQFGEVSVALRLRSGFTIADLLRGDDGERSFEEHLDEFLVEHDSGFSVLAAPKDPAEADAVSPADVTRVLDALRRRADYVVVDTPGALNETVLAALDLTDQLVVMGTPDPPSVRNVGVYLDTVRKLGFPPDHISLIFNKADAEADMARVARLVPHHIDGVLPYTSEASRSVNLGVPVLALNPKADVAMKLASALAVLLPDEDRPRVEEQSPSRRRWVGRLPGRAPSTSVASPAQPVVEPAPPVMPPARPDTLDIPAPTKPATVDQAPPEIDLTDDERSHESAPVVCSRPADRSSPHRPRSARRSRCASRPGHPGGADLTPAEAGARAPPPPGRLGRSPPIAHTRKRSPCEGRIPAMEPVLTQGGSALWHEPAWTSPPGPRKWPAVTMEPGSHIVDK